MLKRFTRYVTQSVAGMIGISVYVLADTFFISVYSGADGLAVLNLILPVYGLIYAPQAAESQPVAVEEKNVPSKNIEREESDHEKMVLELFDGKYIE